MFKSNVPSRINQEYKIMQQHHPRLFVLSLIYTSFAKFSSNFAGTYCLNCWETEFNFNGDKWNTGVRYLFGRCERKQSGVFSIRK